MEIGVATTAKKSRLKSEVLGPEGDISRSPGERPTAPEKQEAWRSRGWRRTETVPRTADGAEAG